MKCLSWPTMVIIIILNIPVETASILKEIIFTQEDPSLGQTINSQNSVLDFVGLAKLHGYPVEKHKVVTEDGYVLNLHRIPDSPRLNSTQKNKPIVYLQHGLLMMVESWVVLGPKDSLAFLLADTGFDVWCGSLRGSYYDPSNGTFSILDKEFWEFSYHEHAIYDLPAFIDYILDYTNSKKLNYIGISMGTTISYVLLSLKPSYNEKMKLVVSLAPVAYWEKELTHPLVRLLARVILNFKPVLEAQEIYGIIPHSKLHSLLPQICADKSVLQFVCMTALFLFAGNDPIQTSSETVEKFSEYYPSGASLKTLYHYAQNVNAGKFQAYDYGYEKNMKRYNQKIPPEYDLKKVSAPVVLIYGRNDALVSIENVLELHRRMPNVLITEAVPYKYFTHADFAIAKDIKKLLNDRIINILKQGEKCE